MNTLKLTFSTSKPPELLMVEFRTPFGERFRAVRGKTGGAFGDAATFQWTSAVKALALLALRGSLFGLKQASISGEARSLASALDYALSKPPVWLAEMFGREPSGELRAKRIFRRTNPERKRPGPVIVSLNEKQFRGCGIEVEIGRSAAVSPTQIQIVYDQLVSSFNERGLVGESENSNRESDPDDPLAVSCDPERTYFAQVYEGEIRASLSCARVFSREWTKNRLRSLAEDPLFLRIHSPRAESLARLGDSASDAHRFGVFDPRTTQEAFSALGAVRILCTVAGVGMYAVGVYLRDVCGLPVEIRTFYPYGVDLVQSARPLHDDAVPTICCTGLGPMSELFSGPRSGYFPIMFGPTISHRLVRLRDESTRQGGSGELLTVAESPTSAIFCYDGLARARVVDRVRHPLRHCEPEDTLRALTADPSRAALLWFPHYHFMERYLGASVFGGNANEAFPQTTVIFGNRILERHSKTLEAVKVLIRNAWLSLLEHPEQLHGVAERIVEDEQYLRFAKRCGGLHDLHGAIGANY